MLNLFFIIILYMNNNNKRLTLEEIELMILRTAVDKINKKVGRKVLNSPQVKDIIDIVELFLKDTGRICYGGTAINNLLPKDDQFYDKEVELPDYDFFSPDALNDAIKLADIYYSKGFNEVEAKAGAHHGTYKVFVNYIPVADITYVPNVIYKKLKQESKRINNITYCPPDFLRMSMYLELSRPLGDTSRWEKVLKRLLLLNKHWPLKGINCHEEDIQRIFQYGTKNKIIKNKNKNKNKNNNDNDDNDEDKFLNNIEAKIHHIIREALVDQNCVFFGAFANKLYLRKKKSFNVSSKKIPPHADFEVLSENPLMTATIIKERLSKLNIKNIKVIKHDAIGEIISQHYEIKIGPESVLFIYKPMGCHSYNHVTYNRRVIRIATIDTMFSLYLAFLFIDKPYYIKNRILCMAEHLFKVQQDNRLKQKGLLKRFSIDCYGEQLTIEKMREEKTKKYMELKDKRGTKEYDEYFLRYIPADIHKKKIKINVKKSKKVNKITVKKKKNKRKKKTKNKSKNKSKTKSKNKSKNKSKKNKSNFFNIFN